MKVSEQVYTFASECSDAPGIGLAVELAQQNKNICWHHTSQLSVRTQLTLAEDTMSYEENLQSSPFLAYRHSCIQADLCLCVDGIHTCEPIRSNFIWYSWIQCSWDSHFWKMCLPVVAPPAVWFVPEFRGNESDALPDPPIHPRALDVDQKTQRKNSQKELKSI